MNKTFAVFATCLLFASSSCRIRIPQKLDFTDYFEVIEGYTKEEAEIRAYTFYKDIRDCLKKGHHVRRGSDNKDAEICHNIRKKLNHLSVHTATSCKQLFTNNEQSAEGWYFGSMETWKNYDDGDVRPHVRSGAWKILQEKTQISLHIPHP